MKIIRLIIIIFVVVFFSGCGVSSNKVPGSPGYVPPLGDVAAPLAPEALTVSVLDATRIFIEWDDNNVNEANFDIERATVFNGSQGGFVVIARISSNKLSFLDSAVQADRTYIYRVRAVNDGGTSAFSNEASGSTAMPALAVNN